MLLRCSLTFNSPVSCLPSTTSVWIVVFCSFLCGFCVFICFVFFVLFVFVLCLVCPILAVFLDCLFLIALSVFSNVYLPVSLDCSFLIAPSVFSNVYLLVVYLYFYIMSWLLVHHQGIQGKALWKSFSSESLINWCATPTLVVFHLYRWVKKLEIDFLNSKTLRNKKKYWYKKKSCYIYKYSQTCLCDHLC
jgi:hypothetical protein